MVDELLVYLLEVAALVAAPLVIARGWVLLLCQ